MSTKPSKEESDHEAAGNDLLEAALAAFHKAWSAGENPDPAEFCRNHPECGPDLQARINNLLYVIGGLPEPDDQKSPASKFPEMPEFIGRFRILRELGRGGQGAVYLAEDEKLHRKVALKILASGFEYSEHQLKRFEREAESASRLNHPGICSVFETGEAEGIHYIAMQYVEGESVAKMIAHARQDPSCFQRGIFETTDTAARVGAAEKDASSTGTDYSKLDAVSKSLYLIEQTARALHVAHESGIIHRDLKPGNIMVTPEGEPVILDFGLARMEECEGPSLTMSTDLFGTPAYMSPEQIRGDKKRIGRRTDIYSLATTLFECLCLRPPFESVTREGLYRAILTDDPPDLRKLRTWMPSDLCVVLQTALAKDPDHRYETALDFAEELRRIRQREPIVTHRAGPLLRLWRWSQRNPRLAAAVGGIIFVLVLGFSVSTYLLGKTTTALHDNQRLSDIWLLPFLDRSAEEDLWPAMPRMVGEIDRWLAVAEELYSRLDQHQESLNTMKQNLGSEDQEHQRTIEQQATFVEKLSLFNSVIKQVKKRRHDAATLREKTVDNYRKEWDETIAAIADKEMNPQYGGLRIDSQIGLIPLGQDPESRLFEFAHFQTGEIRVRDSNTGQLQITEETGLVFVLLPGGSFRMGAIRPDEDHPEGSPYVDPQCVIREESPLRDVDLEPFFISKYEMTQAQWFRITGKKPSNYAPGWAESMKELLADSKPITLRHPVEMVSWNDCSEVLKKLDLLLPTDAQWEYACRGGTTTVFYTGNDPNSLRGYENLGDEAWLKDTRLQYKETLPWNDGFFSHAPVGSFKANPFGLCDMAGNVVEWCRDRLWSSRQDKGTLIPGDGLRIQDNEIISNIYDEKGASVRGGAWAHLSGRARSACRWMHLPYSLICNIGVRPAMKIQ